jgi:hypothetical protein
MENRGLKAAIILRYGSQADFAQELGVTDAIVSRIVRRRRELDEEEKRRWASLLKTEVHELWPEEMKRNAS